MKKDWTFLKENTKYQDKILRVRHEEYHYEPLNETMTYTVVDMSDWVIVIPLTDNDEALLVSQFRAGSSDDTLEFPGGAVNRNEDHKIGALRELEEETGAECRDITLLGVMEPNPAFLTNKCYIYLAEGCSITKPQNLDKFEDTKPVFVKVSKLREMIKSGEFSQGISLAAFGLYLNSRY